MGFELKGVPEMQERLAEVSRASDKLAGQTEVSFDDLFTPEFMAEYTAYGTLEAFLAAVNVTNGEEFIALPEEALNAHVAKATRFGTWDDMMGEAVTAYAAKSLGFD